MRELTIAIDGPASSGKGTVARRVAESLGYAYVDTGAMYRAVGLHTLRAGADPTDPVATTGIAGSLHFGFDWHKGQLRIIVDREDVTTAIRNERVGGAASAVAVHPGVRSALLQTQRDLGAGGGVVMDGRDIGTVVLPDADLKIFLDAALEERARRRHAELPGSVLDEVRGELAARDAQDSGRRTAPLRQAEDAVRVDTTGHTIDEVVERVLGLVHERRGR
ncbi:MAG: (d)CMP kinase [Pseudomonadota bacterium]|nr:(d)CMP kinase [Pseudomonadota bacterium]